METTKTEKNMPRSNETGNIYVLIFGGIALLGVLGYAVSQLVSGPMMRAMELNNKTLTESELYLSAQISATTSSTLNATPDCDGDNLVEPPHARASAADAPNNGGLISASLGVTMADVWGNELGFCTWDVGETANSACDPAVGLVAHLAGSPTPRLGERSSQLVYAIVSAGPDGAFNTTCSAFTNTTTPVIANTGDDIIQSFSYAEAAEAAQGLWSISNGAAEIDRDVRIAGTAAFNSMNTAGKTIASKGLKLTDPNDSLTACSSASDTGTLRYIPATDAMEYCNGSSWTSIGGASTAAARGFALDVDDAAAGCSADADRGKIRYNNTRGVIEFCHDEHTEPVTWRTVSHDKNGITADVSTLEIIVAGATGGGGPYSAIETVTITNNSNKTYNLTATIDDTTYLLIDPSNPGACGATLASGASCTYTIQASDSTGEVYDATLTVETGETEPVTVALTGYGDGFCDVGEPGGGGVWAYCHASDGDYVINDYCQSDYAKIYDMHEPSCDNTGHSRAMWNNPWTTRTRPSGLAIDFIGTGPDNTADLAESFGEFPVAYTCQNLTYGGYDDWYLPGGTLARQIKLNAVADGTDDLELSDTVRYGTSFWTPGATTYSSIDSGGSAAATTSNYLTSTYTITAATAAQMRCLRRHDQ